MKINLPKKYMSIIQENCHGKRTLKQYLKVSKSLKKKTVILIANHRVVFPCVVFLYKCHG